MADDPFFSAISQDGNYLIIGVDDGKLAFDLRTRTQIKLGGDFNHDVSGAFAFKDQALVGESLVRQRTQDGSRSPMGSASASCRWLFATLNSVSKGDYLVTRGGEHNDTLLLNMATQKATELPLIQTLDMWGNSIAMEAPDGSVVIGSYDGTKPMQELARRMLPLKAL